MGNGFDHGARVFEQTDLHLLMAPLVFLASALADQFFPEGRLDHKARGAPWARCDPSPTEE